MRDDRLRPPLYEALSTFGGEGGGSTLKFGVTSGLMTAATGNSWGQGTVLLDDGTDPTKQGDGAAESWRNRFWDEIPDDIPVVGVEEGGLTFVISAGCTPIGG